MARTGKKFTAAKAKVEEKLYQLAEAIPLVQGIKFAAFDESVELVMRLGVNKVIGFLLVVMQAQDSL